MNFTSAKEHYFIQENGSAGTQFLADRVTLRLTSLDKEIIETFNGNHNQTWYHEGQGGLTLLGDNPTTLIEDFEGPIQLNFTNSAWTITNEDSYSGRYSLVHPGASNSFQTSRTVTITIDKPSILVFYYKFVSASGALYVVVNGKSHHVAGGSATQGQMIPWQRYALPIPAGTHQIYFRRSDTSDMGNRYGAQGTVYIDKIIVIPAIQNYVSTGTSISNFYLFNEGTINGIKLRFTKTEPTLSVDLTPQMSGYTFGQYAVSASSEYSTSYCAWYAFDHNTANTSTFRWRSANLPAWIQWDFGSPILIEAYRIKLYTYNLAYPKNWTLEGSNDGTTWDILDVQQNYTWPGNSQVWIINNQNAYRYYRIHVTAVQGSSTPYVEIEEIEFYQLCSTSATIEVRVSPDNGYTWTPWVVAENDVPLFDFQGILMRQAIVQVRYSLSSNHPLTSPMISNVSLIISSTAGAFYTIITDRAQLNSQGKRGIVKLAIRQNEPPNTKIRYAISVDGRATWKVWDGTQWQTLNHPNEVHWRGMSKDTLLSLKEQHFQQIFQSGSVDYLIGLSSTDTTAKPEVFMLQTSWTTDGNNGKGTVGCKPFYNTRLIPSTFAVADGLHEMYTHIGTEKRYLIGSKDTVYTLYLIQAMAGFAESKSHSERNENEQYMGLSRNADVGVKDKIIVLVLPSITGIAERIYTSMWAPSYQVGDFEKIVERLIEVQTMFQPRKLPLNWHPEAWNGQKLKR